MRKLVVTVDVPEYNSNNPFTYKCGDQSKLLAFLLDGDCTLSANRGGLADLARLFLYLAQKDAPNGASIRLTDKNGLMKGSFDLKIRKEENPSEVLNASE